MDRILIAQKLESLRRCVARIGSKCPSDPQVLMRDPDVQDIVSLNLSRAVQLCVDIGAHWIVGLDVPPPQTMGETFDRLSQAGVLDGELATRLKKAEGFRNVAVHDYRSIDWLIVHRIARQHLDDFTAFARAVAQHAGL